MKKKIICIVGKSGVGKDTFSRLVSERLGISIVCSYTTRDKRVNETDGVEHYFITSEEMTNILKTQEVIAYVKKDSGVEYAATLESIPDKSIYIIDPAGIHYLKEKFSDKASLYVVQLTCPEDIVEQRIKERNDDWDTYVERRENEREEFDSFKDWDISISTTIDVNTMYDIFYEDYVVKFSKD